MRRVLTVFAAALAAAALTAPAASAAPEFASYVALGDSYTSGSLIPNQVDLLCTRSDRNYPSLVAESLEPGEVTDVSCGGATTADMTASQLLTSNPPQFDALKPDTELVTVGIGGNDVPFAEVVLTCGGMGLLVPHGSPCKDFYTSSGTDGLAEKVRAAGVKVGAVLAGIHQRSPQAKVVLVGYPTLLPDDGTNCWPLVPISDGDAPYLRDVTKLLNTVLAEQAAAHDASFVDTYRSSVGHDMCKAPGVKWVEGIFPSAPAAPVHPNAAGARNQAAQVLDSLGS
ncbi:SGNH/GDSL hydrolase family protein [Amycolatopsis nigrescens]|uniref:SGNH/GDSL hydrolase family protein n=1 Tax=Amycolatopsis nigrescens TaxID=381445 RepID=UPI0003619C39|nr:SGNH/GDSL hydrolase family protein [Amycolatopsis nigrescens]